MSQSDLLHCNFSLKTPTATTPKQICCVGSAGYNNDTYFYQRPQQPMWGPSSDAYANGDGGLGESGGQIGPEEMGVFEGEAKPSISEDKIPKMRSGLFLILHNVSSTVFLSSCAGELFLPDFRTFQNSTPKE